MNDLCSTPSPCTGVCFIDPESTHCVGCARTLDEIQSWGAISDDARRRVLATLAERRARDSR